MALQMGLLAKCLVTQWATKRTDIFVHPHVNNLNDSIFIPSHLFIEDDSVCSNLPSCRTWRRASRKSLRSRRPSCKSCCCRRTFGGSCCGYWSGEWSLWDLRWWNWTAIVWTLPARSWWWCGFPGTGSSRQWAVGSTSGTGWSGSGYCCWWACWWCWLPVGLLVGPGPAADAGGWPLLLLSYGQQPLGSWSSSTGLGSRHSEGIIQTTLIFTFFPLIPNINNSNK